MKHPFQILLTAEAISAFGSQITIVALPLIAVLLLQATPFEMGLLQGVTALPGVIFGVLAGFAVDRLPKRRVLILCNLLCAIALATIPLAYATQLISIYVLIGVTFVAASVGNIQGITLSSFIPSIVKKDHLGKANGHYYAIMATATIVGPGVAGLLIAKFNAPDAIIFDMISFVMAAFLIFLLPSSRELTIEVKSERPITQKFLTSVKIILKDPTLRLVVMFGGFVNFFGAVILALEALFVVKYLGLSADWFALAIGFGGVGAILGGIISGHLVRLFSLNSVMGIAFTLLLIAYGSLSVAHGDKIQVALYFSLSKLVSCFAFGLVNVTMMTHVQRTVPATVIASVIGILIGLLTLASPIGAIAGGTFAEIFGLRETLIMTTLGFLIVLIAFLLRSRNYYVSTNIKNVSV